jgi:excisionase family DNA binding protein
MSAIEKQPRFLTLADVAEVLATSTAQVYALVRRGELRAIQIGGRGQWRVEAVELEAFIQRMYAQTANLAADRTDDRVADRDGSSTSTAT